MKFIDDFLVKPRTKARKEVAFERVSEEALVIQDFIGVSLQMFQVLFRKDPADDFLMGRSFLFV